MLVPIRIVHTANVRNLTHFFNMLIDEFCSAKNQKTNPPNWELDGLRRIGNVLWGGISETRAARDEHRADLQRDAVRGPRERETLGVHKLGAEFGASLRDTSTNDIRKTMMAEPDQA